MTTIRRAAPLAVFLLLVGLAPVEASPAAPATVSALDGLRPVEGDGVATGISRPARRLPIMDAPTGPVAEAPERRTPLDAGPQDGDPGTLVSAPIRSRMPATSVSFDGMGASGVIPPDPSGEVGLDHFVQMVNGPDGAQYRVYSKTGTALTGVLRMGDLWANTDACSSDPTNGEAGGDGNVLYDQFADRWIMTQFTNPADNTGPYYICIASSQTADPTGAWYTHRFTQANGRFPDYLKFGIFGDGLYMTANEFGDDSAEDGIGIRAMERADLYTAGSVNGWYWHLAGSNDFHSLVPVDVDGPTAPPAGEDAWFLAYSQSDANTLQRWHASVPSWTDPANVILIQEPDTPVAPFTPNLCVNVYFCIPQPGTGQTLDSITDGLMWRMAYRNIGGTQTMVVTHAVNVGDQRTGIRWYLWEWTAGQEPDAPSQTGTYSPDAVNRWIPTPAIDRHGNIAIGYNVSDATSVYPGIRYAGRLITDPPGTLGQGEAVLQAGGGAQTSASGRWGDYAQMSVDPTDDCTFWFTGPYIATGTVSSWSTRIGAFEFPSCDASAASATGKLSKPYRKKGATFLYHFGDRESFTMTVTPAAVGEAGSIWIERKSAAGWVSESDTACVLDANSRCRLRFNTRSVGRGTYRVQGSYPGDGDPAGAVTAWAGFKITR